jgi:hypothetical protein
MHALAVILLLAPPAPEPSWGDMRPADAPVEAAPVEAAPVDAAPVDAAPAEAAPAETTPPPQPPPPQQPPVAQPPPPPSTPSRPDRPIRWRLDVKLEAGATRPDSPTWYAASSKRVDNTIGVGLNYDFRPGGGRVYFGPTLGFRAWGEQDYVHQALDISLQMRELLAGARLSIAVLDGLDLFLQPRGGPVFVRRYVAGNNFAAESDRALLGAAEAMAGLSLYLPKRWLPRKRAARVTGGLELAAGWSYRSPVAIRGKPVEAEDAIPTQTADFGRIPLHGVVWHIGVFIRFM